MTMGELPKSISVEEALAVTINLFKELQKERDAALGRVREFTSTLMKLTVENERLRGERDLAVQANELNFEKYVAGVKKLKERVAELENGLKEFWARPHDYLAESDWDLIGNLIGEKK